MQCYRLIVDIADPMRLLKDMQTEGLTLKQNVLGRVFDPSDPNQVGILSPRHQTISPPQKYISGYLSKGQVSKKNSFTLNLQRNLRT